MDKKLVVTLSIAIIAFLLLSALLQLGIAERWNLKLTDTLYGGKKPLENIVILKIDDKSIQQLGRWPWNREVWVNVFNKLRDAEVVGVDVAFFEPYKKDVDEQLGEAIGKIKKIVIPIEFLKYSVKDGRLEGVELLEPIPELQGKASAAFINVFTDPDSLTRRVSLKIGNYSGFAYQVYKLYMNRELEIPEDRILVNFVGSPFSFKSYSISDFLQNNTALDLKNKIILIGATAADLHDDYFVPTSEGRAMPGVEVHANTVQTLITKDFLKTESYTAVVLTLLALALIVALCMYKLKLWLASIISALLFIAYLVASVLAFDKGIIMNFVYPFLSIVLTYVPSVGYYYLIEERQRKKVTNLFGKYVSKEVVTEIMKSKEGIDLKGIEREISILFADIRGFTSMSEKMKPHEVVAMLNKYLTEMTNAIFESHGTLDKYIGDCVMAVFNAPIEHKEHALNAVNAAVEMVKRVEALGGGIHVGVGVNTGPAVIGNIGSKDRLDYTSIGDSVNLASRIEGLNKPYGTYVIISEATFRQLGSHNFTIRELDKVAVKGKKEAITVYEVVVFPNAKLIDEYNKGLELYKQRKFKEAMKYFEACVRIKADKPSEIYIERCEEFIANPPPKDWSGVTEMKTK